MSAVAGPNENSVMLRQFFTLRWILTTLLVITAMGVMARLGIWQLERLAQRRALNARIEAGMALPPLDLNQYLPLPVDTLTGMAYRAVKATGQYDPSEEIVWRNQILDGQAGYQVLTPLRIDGTPYSLLVDRGWAPLDQGSPEKRAAFAQKGSVTVEGRLVLSQNEPVFGGVPDPTLTAGQTRLDGWNFVNLERIGKQVSRPLLPVFLIAAPEGGASAAGTNGLKRVLPEYDLSEGPHESYALQWFAFALTLGLGYPFYVRKQLRQPQSPK
jgi:surfeit locus 1 family protein